MTPRVRVLRTSMSSVSRRSSPVFAFLSFLSFMRTVQRQRPVLIVQSDGTPLVEHVVTEDAVDLLSERRLDLVEALRQSGTLRDLPAADGEPIQADHAPFNGRPARGCRGGRSQGVQ